MGREARIVKPTGDRQFALHEVSKQQLAMALNEQSARFKVLRDQHEIATKVLGAIVLEPEAFQFQSDGVTVDMAAYTKVRDGMQLLIDQDGTVLRLRLVDPAAQAVATPHIVIARGGA